MQEGGRARDRTESNRPLYVYSQQDTTRYSQRYGTESFTIYRSRLALETVAAVIPYLLP